MYLIITRLAALQFPLHASPYRRAVFGSFISDYGRFNIETCYNRWITGISLGLVRKIDGVLNRSSYFVNLNMLRTSCHYFLNGLPQAFSSPQMRC